ncbi:MAG: hypothetical protein IPO07_31135 [Haliscomenobacter sp.]|nr:hypothetical protein [Haliscomenobacter sp.]MBK9492733.1 hypothetical protein [Haliscomenobacter sp.]
MKFFHPVIQLGKESGELADKYFLHVVTFCPRSNFQADGFSIKNEKLAEGRLKVTVKLKQRLNFPILNSLLRWCTASTLEQLLFLLKIAQLK